MEVLKPSGKGQIDDRPLRRGMMFGFAGVAAGRRVAVHPMAKAAVTGPSPRTPPSKSTVPTPRRRARHPAMIRQVVEALKWLNEIPGSANGISIISERNRRRAAKCGR